MFVIKVCSVLIVVICEVYYISLFYSAKLAERNMIVRSGAVLSLLGAFLAVSGAPYGDGHGDGEFRDKKYDEQLKQVSKVGNTYVSGGNVVPGK